MNDNQGDIPGYFTGRPMNYAEPKEKEPEGVDEQKAVNTQTPGDYFVGRPANLEKQQPQQPVPDRGNKQSFLAKCCPCLAGGGAAD